MITSTNNIEAYKQKYNKGVYPTLEFTWSYPDQLFMLDEILSCDKDTLIKVNSRYSVISHSSEPLLHNCPIIDILQESIFRDRFLRETYDGYVEKYGQDIVDIFIHKDKKIISNKITSIINFVMDDIYKSNIINIKFRYEIRPMSNPLPYELPNLIYHTIQMYFWVHEKFHMDDGNEVLIIERIFGDGKETSKT